MPEIYNNISSVRLSLTKVRQVRLGHLFFRYIFLDGKLDFLNFRISDIFRAVMHYYVYTLLSQRDKKFYTGLTTDLKKRLTEHAHGEVTATRTRRPVLLIHYEYFINKADAKACEVFLKSGFGRNNLKEALRKTLT